MKQIYLLVEGQTEEAFVKKVMGSYYSRIGLYFIPICVRTSRSQKGGATHYGKIKNDIEKLCKQHDRSDCYISTLFDLYALPKDFPGKNAADFPKQGNGWQKAQFLENKLGENIGRRNFIPNLLVHEFEALLFSKPVSFAKWADDKALKELHRLCKEKAPEEINDSPENAPSKRILRLLPGYQKVFHGTAIAADIGLETICEKCPHFAAWLQRLEQL